MIALLHPSAGNDYVETSTMGDLGPSNDRVCLNISVIDDLDVEAEERFIVTLTTTDPDVDVAVTSASVVIEDNDGEQGYLLDCGTLVRIRWLSDLALCVGVTIGFEVVSVDVLESAQQAQLCVAVLQPAGIALLPFGITVTASSMEVTAGESCLL